MKLCKDAKILDSHLTRTNVDLIFTKVKSKVRRRVDEILVLIADTSVRNGDCC